jgi:N,N'-diacetyllegionaminate synthase
MKKLKKIDNTDQGFPFEEPVYIIAELANAAQGEVKINLKLIEEANKAGANAIKLQLYKYDELATPLYNKYEIFKRTFYSFEERTQFINRAYELNLDVWVDIFDRWGLNVALKNKDKIRVVKIPSAVVLDNDLVKKIFKLRLPTAVGIGGYEDKNIDYVLSQLSGFRNPILLMYGFQGFPTSEEDTSLIRIQHLKNKYGYPVGFADHVNAESELALRMPEYAFFSGASVIEKHITLDRSAKGLDYYSALEPHEFRKMVGNLKQCLRIYGTSQITAAQKNYLKHATRITSVRPIKSGELLFLKDIKFRRTCTPNALFPNEIEDYFPAVALQDLDKDAGIRKKDIKKATAGVIVVCRLNSKRLPRKALLELNGIPAIERCLLNTLASKLSSMTILATSIHREDKELKEHTLDGEVKFFQGSENDPAARMLDAAELYDLDFIVRVTGDSPLISYELIDLLLESHFHKGADFSFFKDAPLGTKPEVINKKAIKRLKSMTDTDNHSEYLSLYFKNNPDIFLINEAPLPENFSLPKYRLVLDYPEDYEVLKTIFEGLKIGKEPLSLSQVIEFMQAHPEVEAINARFKPKYEIGEYAEFINKVTKINTVLD